MIKNPYKAPRPMKRALIRALRPGRRKKGSGETLTKKERSYITVAKLKSTPPQRLEKLTGNYVASDDRDQAPVKSHRPYASPYKRGTTDLKDPVDTEDINRATIKSLHQQMSRLIAAIHGTPEGLPCLLIPERIELAVMTAQRKHTAIADAGRLMAEIASLTGTNHED